MYEVLKKLANHTLLLTGNKLNLWYPFVSSDHPVPVWTPFCVCAVDCFSTTRPCPACWSCCLWMNRSSTPAACTVCSGISAITLKHVGGSFAACCPSSNAAARVRCVWRPHVLKTPVVRGAPREAVGGKALLPPPYPLHPLLLHPHLPP